MVELNEDDAGEDDRPCEEADANEEEDEEEIIEETVETGVALENTGDEVRAVVVTVMVVDDLVEPIEEYVLAVDALDKCLVKNELKKVKSNE